MAKNRPKKEAKTDPEKGVKNGGLPIGKVGKFVFSGKVGFWRIWEVVFRGRILLKNGQKSGSGNPEIPKNGQKWSKMGSKIGVS
jgi:hypothetical protein